MIRCANPDRAITMKRTWTSLFIASGLILQALASFAFLDKRYWPFIRYPMYCKPHYAGEGVAHFALVGRTSDAREIELSAAALGLGFWHYMKGPVAAAETRGAEGLAPYLEDYAGRTGIHFDAVRIVNRPVALGPRGLERRPEETVLTITVAGGKAE